MPAGDSLMDSIRVKGGNQLNGRIPISGAKNAALPLMIASLLTDDTLTLENVPHLADVEQLIRILGNHGVDYSVNGRREKQQEGYSRTINFSARQIVDTTAPYELVSKMRASFWVIGPLLARMGEAKVSLPGGCAIGTRPVDLFLDGLQALGAELDVESGYVVAKTKNGRLVGNRHAFPSLGRRHPCADDTLRSPGETVLENAAREPEIVNLAECLNAMGARSPVPAPRPSPSRARSAVGARHRVKPTARDRHLRHGGRHDRRHVLLEGARDLCRGHGHPPIRAEIIGGCRHPRQAQRQRRTRRRRRPSPSPASRPTCRRSSWA